MATQDLEKRVENIEETLRVLVTVPARLGGLEGQVGRLEGRVGGLETQFLQSREEVRLEFSAVHGELHELRDGQRELREGQEGLGSQMRMLYEDLVERIKRLGEGGAFLGGRS